MGHPARNFTQLSCNGCPVTNCNGCHGTIHRRPAPTIWIAQVPVSHPLGHARIGDVSFRSVQLHRFFQSFMQPVIQVSGIRKTYGQTVAVDEVSFEVNEGEIFGLIGPNGAGKTTTMECIEGIRKPDRGTISVLGLDPFRDVYKLQERIGVQLQQAQLQKRIKVWEAVDLWASLYPNPVDGDKLLEQLGLADKRNAWFMTLSGGQKQRLFIALKGS